MSTAQSRADAHDHLAPDHSPVCPSCQEIQPIEARWCGDCGTWLHHEAPTSAAMRKRALDAAKAQGLRSRARMTLRNSPTQPPSGEAASPAKGMGS